MKHSLLPFFLFALSPLLFLPPVGLAKEGAATPDSAKASTARPNVILIMADDFGYECLTANGGESYQTPNLDKLAASGVRFEHCYVQPLCTPTRVQLMTGRYNVRNYLNFGTLPRSENDARLKLQAALDQFKDARPAKLDRQFEQSMPGLKRDTKKKNDAKE